MTSRGKLQNRSVIAHIEVKGVTLPWFHDFHEFLTSCICCSERSQRHSLLFLGWFHDESLVDVRNDTTASDCGLDQSVELFVSPDGKLQMSWGNSLDLEVLWSVTSKLKNLGRQVLENSSAIDCWSGTNSTVGADSALQESMDSSDWELNSNN